MCNNLLHTYQVTEKTAREGVCVSDGGRGAEGWGLRGGWGGGAWRGGREGGRGAVEPSDSGGVWASQRPAR